VDGELGLMASGPVTLDLDPSDTEVYVRLEQGGGVQPPGPALLRQPGGDLGGAAADPGR